MVTLLVRLTISWNQRHQWARVDLAPAREERTDCAHSFTSVRVTALIDITMALDVASLVKALPNSFYLQRIVNLMGQDRFSLTSLRSVTSNEKWRYLWDIRVLIRMKRRVGVLVRLSSAARIVVYLVICFLCTLVVIWMFIKVAYLHVSSFQLPEKVVTIARFA